MLEPWFQIIPGKVVDNVIAPIDLPADKYPAIMTLEKFLKMGDAIVHYNYNDAIRMPSVIFEPTFMVAMDDILDVGESNGWSSAEYRKALFGIVREERTAL